MIKTILLTVLLSGCASSQLIKETSNGGRVIVLGSKSIGAAKGVKSAKAKMSEKCPKGYNVTEKGWMDVSSINPGQTLVQERYFEFKCK